MVCLREGVKEKQDKKKTERRKLSRKICETEEGTFPRILIIRRKGGNEGRGGTLTKKGGEADAGC